MKCVNCEQELNERNTSSDKEKCWLCNGEKCPCCDGMKLEDVWEKLTDTPTDEHDRIDCNFLHFPKLTHREEIWKWIEETYNVSVNTLMYGEEK